MFLDFSTSATAAISTVATPPAAVAVTAAIPAFFQNLRSLRSLPILENIPAGVRALSTPTASAAPTAVPQMASEVVSQSSSLSTEAIIIMPWGHLHLSLFFLLFRQFFFCFILLYLFSIVKNGFPYCFRLYIVGFYCVCDLYLYFVQPSDRHDRSHVRKYQLYVRPPL